MSREDVVKTARAGLYTATLQLKEEIDKIHTALLVSREVSDEEEEGVRAALHDVSDAYAIFHAAALFYDRAKNQ